MPSTDHSAESLLPAPTVFNVADAAPPDQPAAVREKEVTIQSPSTPQSFNSGFNII